MRRKLTRRNATLADLVAAAFDGAHDVTASPHLAREAASLAVVCWLLDHDRRDLLARLQAHDHPRALPEPASVAA